MPFLYPLVEFFGVFAGSSRLPHFNEFEVINSHAPIFSCFRKYVVHYLRSKVTIELYDESVLGHVQNYITFPKQVEGLVTIWRERGVSFTCFTIHSFTVIVE